MKNLIYYLDSLNPDKYSYQTCNISLLIDEMENKSSKKPITKNKVLLTCVMKINCILSSVIQPKIRAIINENINPKYIANPPILTMFSLCFSFYLEINIIIMTPNFDYFGN